LNRPFLLLIVQLSNSGDLSIVLRIKTCSLERFSAFAVLGGSMKNVFEKPSSFTLVRIPGEHLLQRKLLNLRRP